MSRRRRLAIAAAAVGAATVPAVTWAGSRALTNAPRGAGRNRCLEARFHTIETANRVHGLDQAVVELRGRGAHAGGQWGLTLPDAYTRIGAPLSAARGEPGAVDAYSLRPYHGLEGELPTADRQTERRGDDRRGERERGSRSDRAGSRPGGQDTLERDRRGSERRRGRTPPPWPVAVSLSAHAWPEDPQVLARETGSRWQIDAVPAREGHLTAWRFTPPARLERAGGTWLIGVHGRGASRAELFRIVACALDADVTCLVTSYRTDRWTAAPEPLTTLGSTEWRDLEAAVAEARRQGAERVVLAGCSLGGSIVASMLRRSALASHVAGVVLDSPALEWASILRHVASGTRLPPALVPAVMWAARRRAKLDWSALDHVAGAAEFRQPMLLAHGTDDPVVPVWLSDALAAARPDLVTYLRVEGAGHVRAWNHAPLRYEQHLRRFLRCIASLTPERI